MPTVTCVDQAKVPRSFAFFRKVFDEVAGRYPDVAADHLYVDAAALELVRRPERFDVMVTENLLGDILSDLAAGLIGGMGVAPSADLAIITLSSSRAMVPPRTWRNGASPTLWQPFSHAPCCYHLGRAQRNDAPARAARRIESAVALALADSRFRTADIGGGASTKEVTSAILARLIEK